jgi:hypothetical protein
LPQLYRPDPEAGFQQGGQPEKENLLLRQLPQGISQEQRDIGPPAEGSGSDLDTAADSRNRQTGCGRDEANPMTPTRLRQIAEHLEKNCSSFRYLTQGIALPCAECRKEAEELRELARQIGPQHQVTAA